VSDTQHHHFRCEISLVCPTVPAWISLL